MKSSKERELEKEDCADTISVYLSSVHKQLSGLRTQTTHSLTRRQFTTALEHCFRCDDAEHKATEQAGNCTNVNEYKEICYLLHDILLDAQKEWKVHVANTTNEVQQEPHCSEFKCESKTIEEPQEQEKEERKQNEREYYKNNNSTSTPSLSNLETSQESHCMPEQCHSLVHSEQTNLTQTNHNSSESFSSCISSSSSSSLSSSSLSSSSSSSEVLKAEAHTSKKYDEHTGLAESTKMSECVIDACNNPSALSALKQFLISYQRQNKANFDTNRVIAPTTAHYCASVFKPMWWMLVKTLSPRKAITSSSSSSSTQTQTTEELSETVEHSFLPTMTELRNTFMYLHPMHQSPFCAEGVETSKDFESQLDYFVRYWNSGPSALSELLCCNLSPSLRRLVYAAALELPFCVLKNQMLRSNSNVIYNTNTKSISHIYSIPQLLSFHLSHESNIITNFNTTSTTTGKQEMCNTQSAYRSQHYISPRRDDIISRLKFDNEFYVANDDRYFIFVDDVDALLKSQLLESLMVLASSKQNDFVVCNEKESKGNDNTNIKQRANCKAGSEASFTTVQMETNQIRMRVERIVNLKGNNTESKRTEKPQIQFLPLLRGFTMLFAPICYMCSNTNEQVALAIAMYKELWCHVQYPSVELLRCCLLFESIINDFARTAYHHVIKELQYTDFMSHVVINWITTSFTTVFTPTEVLSLWDMMFVLHLHRNGKYKKATLSRSNDNNVNNCANDVNNNCRLTGESIFMHDGVLLLPLIAAALFIYRAPLVLRCQSREEIDTVFRTAHECKSKQLLQFLLFLEK